LHIRQGINNRHANYEKQIRHFLDGDWIGTVAYNPEQGEKPKRETQLQIDTLQKVRKKKYGCTDQYIGEQVILTPGMSVINIPDNDHCKCKINEKPEKHHQEIMLVEKFNPK